MIQRIQTIYMLIASVLSILFAVGLTLWSTAEGGVSAMANPVYVALAGVSAGILLANIFNFKKRKLQVVLNRGGILVNMVLAGFVIYEYITLLQKQLITAPGLGIVTPLITIILIVMANRSITKDENLVRSADRFR